MQTGDSAHTTPEDSVKGCRVMMWTSRILVLIGALNWGLIGFFGFDLVAALFGGQNAFLSRVVYSLVGLAGIYMLATLGGRTTARAE